MSDMLKKFSTSLPMALDAWQQVKISKLDNCTITI